MPVGLNLRTLFLILKRHLFEVQYSNKSQHMARLISRYFNHDRPRRVHLVSVERVSTVHSPSTERERVYRIFYCISFAAFIGPAISHPIPIRSRSVGHLRSVYVSFSFFSLAVSPTRRDLSISHFSRACGSGKREGIVFVYLS